MAGFLSRGKFRDVVNDPAFQKDPNIYKTSDAVEAPELGEGSFFDPNLQLVVIGDKKRKEPSRDEEAAGAPTTRRAKPEDQLAFYAQGGSDSDFDPANKEVKAKWLEQFHRTFNKRKFKNLADYTKFVSGIRGQGVEHLGTQGIQGTIQAASLQFMPKNVKEEFDRLQKRKGVRSELKEALSFNREIAQEAAAGGLEFDPRASQFSPAKPGTPTRTEKRTQQRGEDIDEIKETLRSTPGTIAVVERGNKFEGLRDPKKIRIVPEGYLDERVNLVRNSEKFEELDLGVTRDEPQEIGIGIGSDGLDPTQSAEPFEDRLIRLQAPVEFDESLTQINEVFPDLTDEEMQFIIEGLGQGMTVEELITRAQSGG